MLCYENRKNTLTVRLTGELDHSAATSIRRELDALIAEPGVKTLVLDLQDMPFMDSSGIGVLLGRLRTLQNRGGSMSVKNMQPPVEKLFRLSGMHRVIGIEKDSRGGRQ